MKQYNPDKRVNVVSREIRNETGQITQEGGLMLRTTRSLAERLVSHSNYAYVSKGALRSFMNRDKKISKTDNYINKHGSVVKPEQLIKSKHTTKKYVLLPVFDGDGMQTGMHKRLYSL